VWKLFPKKHADIILIKNELLYSKKGLRELASGSDLKTVLFVS
jgi:hypothetical protein